MAFSYAVSYKDSSGKGYVVGTFNSAGVTSGTIVTGLNTVNHFSTGATSATPTLPQTVATGGSVAISGLTAGQTGTWLAIGV